MNPPDFIAFRRYQPTLSESAVSAEGETYNSSQHNRCPLFNATEKALIESSTAYIPRCMLANARSFVSWSVMPPLLKIISLFTEAKMEDTRGLHTSQPSPCPCESSSSSNVSMPTLCVIVGSSRGGTCARVKLSRATVGGGGVNLNVLLSSIKPLSLELW